MNPGNYNENAPQSPGPQPPAPQRPYQYKFTPDELRVMRECNKESFWKRCLPLGTTLGMVSYLGVQSGYLSRHPRWGAMPKVAVGVIVGYFLGKFSYQGKCAEKLMQLPNSQFGEMLRQRRRGQLKETLDPGFGPAMTLGPFSTPTETYTDVPQASYMDIDTSRPQNDGLDDNFRPSMDNPIYEEEMPPIQKHTTSYEELRKRNRDEYQQSRTGAYRPSTEPRAHQAPVQVSKESFDTDTTPQAPSVQNKYGDAWV